MSGANTARCVWALNANLGEGPVWVAFEQALYFVDVLAPALHRYSLKDGATRSWAMPETMSWLIPRASRPGFMAGFKRGFAELSLDPLDIRLFAEPEPELPDNRRNDAKVDRWGRIWAGSMDDGERSASGALFRLDPDLSWRRMDEGYVVANGPAFNLAGNVMYHTDSMRRVVYAFDLHADGRIENKRVFLCFPEDWGFPDGMTTDVEDGLWIAHFGGGRVSRFTPDGKLDRAIAIPASYVTSCAFAGDALERLYITTARIGRDDEALAGGLFEVDVGVRGVAQTPFAG